MMRKIALRQCTRIDCSLYIRVHITAENCRRLFTTYCTRGFTTYKRINYRTEIPV